MRWQHKWALTWPVPIMESAGVRCQSLHAADDESLAEGRVYDNEGNAVAANDAVAELCGYTGVKKRIRL